MVEAAPRIRVVVRKRPLTQKETKRGDLDIVKVLNDQTLHVEELK
jgi:hypothetical protein